MAGGKNWVIEIKEQLESDDVSREAEQWSKHSIHKIPSCFKNKSSNAYIPRTVSIGPYYHGQEHLIPMEHHKRRALLHFLRRSNKPVELFIDSVTEVLQELKDSYDPLDLCWQQDIERFVEMMIVDGCFFLEIFCYLDKMLNDYAPNDPIFSVHGEINMMPHIMIDIVMLENQLPLLVLHKLLAVQGGEDKDENYVNRLILRRLRPHSGSLPQNLGKCLHILDVYRKTLLHQEQRSRRKKTTRQVHYSSKSIIHGLIAWSARELSDGGISFRKSRTTSLTDISFRRNILRLPQLIVDDTTESVFLNLMAFERLHPGAGSEVTSFVYFMDSMIRNEKDIVYLESKGILLNALGSEKDVVKLFASLSSHIILDPANDLEIVQIYLSASLDSVRTKVYAYRKSVGREFRAKVASKYFSSPRAMFSLVYAILFAVLTVAQTVYTILSYYHQSGKQ